MVGAGLAAIAGPQARFFCSHCLPAMWKAGLWQSRQWAFLLAWSQGGPEKLISEAALINGITALFATTGASLSFPLQRFQILLLSSSQYLVLFVCCFTVTFPSPPPTDATFPFYSPTLCSLRALCLDVQPFLRRAGTPVLML